MRASVNQITSITKWPLSETKGPREKAYDAQCEHAQSEEYDVDGRRGEDEQPADKRNNGWQRIQPDAKRPCHPWGTTPKEDDTADLPDKLHENSCRNQRVDHEPQ